MRLIARFAVERSEAFEVITLFEQTIGRTLIGKEAPKIDSIAREYPAAIWFERKMHDDFGIRIEKAFDRRPLVHHERFPSGLHPLRSDFTATRIEAAPFRPYAYETVSGDGVFEVGVGPIHAGIIEPGHFHFSQAGEEMLHQEVRHFYTHRGIEKMVEGMDLFEAKPIIERISGNESVAYQYGWFDLLMQAAKETPPPALRSYHAILLELERIAHHLTDMGFIPNDAGFAAALAYASRLAEETRRRLASLCGHRFGFGGVGFRVPDFDKRALLHFLQSLEREVELFRAWITDIPSLSDRLDSTGRLTHAQARLYGVVGVMARASGIALDRRLEDPLYQEAGFAPITSESGDVAARLGVRMEEVARSIALIRRFVEKVEPGRFAPPEEVQDGEYMSFTESSIGELFLYLRIEQGKIARLFVRDPSFVNWQALHLMMPGNIIPDFPLINKSCDLSYAGNDL